MAGTHGDLFQEIGALVVAAHEGDAIDLRAKADELARRYKNLKVPADTIARAIARSASAVGVSMAMVQLSKANAIALDAKIAATEEQDDASPGAPADNLEKSPAMVFPSGVRLAVLS